MKLVFRSYIEAFVRLFYPSLCIGCGTDLLDGESFLCMRCDALMVPADHSSGKGNPVYALFEASIPLSGGIAAFYYHRGSLIQRLIYRVKYQGRQDLGRWLGRRLGNILLEVDDLPVIDYIIPVPLHPSKLKARGFNQSSLLAEGIAGKLDRPVLNDLLIRMEKGESQTHAARIGRWENVRDGFAITDGSRLQSKTFLLVDDVVTTGSTMLACARRLLEQEKCKVFIAAVAVAGEY